MVSIVIYTLKKRFQCKIFHFIILLGLACNLSSHAQNSTQTVSLYKHAVSEEILKQYPVLPYKFIDLIKAIPKPLPASLDRFQKIFNHQFHITEKDDSSIIYGVRTFRTLDGVIIESASLTTDLNTNKVTWFSIELDKKQCVNSKILKKEFGFLVPIILRTPFTSTSPIGVYTRDEWGKFSLLTTMRDNDCADGVGVRVFFDKQEKKKWVKYARKYAPYLRAKERQSELEGK